VRRLRACAAGTSRGLNLILQRFRKAQFVAINAALDHHLFDVAKTQAESKVQPHAVADDLRGEAMAFVRADR
jgi:hypothetical protein